MIRIPSEAWSKLEGALLANGQLVARAALPEGNGQLMCALDGRGQRHLLIPLKADERAFRDNNSRGIRVTTDELALEGSERVRYLDIICLDVTGHEALDIIGGEISVGLAQEQFEPADVVRRVLTRWRRFWGEVPISLLSREEIVGLFAEIWFLSTWLIPNCGAIEAIARWHGPEGTRHDFYWQKAAVEVKGTVSQKGRIHHVNGLSQLSEPSSGQLFLFSLVMQEDSSAQNSLTNLVKTAQSLLVSHDAAIDRFEQLLTLAGYSPAHDDEYEKMKVQVTQEALFAVQNDFPRLTPDSLINGDPPGVGEVRYEINLNGFDHLIVSRLPTSVEILR